MAGELRRGHPVADAIGAVLRGAREGDARTRKNAAGWLKLLGGGGLAIWIAVGAVADWREQARETRRDTAAAQAALVAALREQTVSIDNLVWSMWETNGNSTQEHAAIMRKLKVDAPPKVTRPARPARPEEPWNP